MTPIDTFLARVEGARRSGAGWQARCPAHDDRRPSLTFTEADGSAGAPVGAVLAHCHAGCTFEQIVAAAGLSVADTFLEGTGSGVEWHRTYTYADADGEVLYRVRRGTRPNGQRQFETQHPEGDGWAPKYGDDDRRVLYRLPELVNNPDLPVWVTEGERDADTLGRLGLVATTVAHGSWTDVDLSPLAGRQAIVVVDNDAAGWRKGKKAQEAVVSAGARLIYTRRPLDGHKDVTDHIAAGASTDLLPVVDLTDEQPPAAAPPPSRSAFTSDGSALRVFTPYGVLLHFVQAGKLTPLDVTVWTLMEGRAGRSGIARLTIREIAGLVSPSERTAKEHSISKSIARLKDAGLVDDDGRKRGEWTVRNPCFADRRGETPTEITFRDRNTTPSNPTSSSTTPQYEPRETPPEGRPALPERAVRTRGNPPQKGGSHSSDDAERLLRDQFGDITEEVDP